MARDVKMSLVEHLDELRARVIYAGTAVVLIAIGAYLFRDALMAVLTRPLVQYYQISMDQVPTLLEALRKLFEESGHFSPEQTNALLMTFKRLLAQQSGLIFIHPTEAFVSYLKLALYTGLLLGSPFVLYQVWRFILPALYDNERRYFLGTFTFGSTLFYTGASFAFVWVLPLVVRFLINIGGTYLQANFTIGNYISFSMMFLLAFGLVFELPVVVFLAVRTGLVSTEFLRQKRRYVLVLAFLGAAMITPPDVFSQIALAVPVAVLYEVSLQLARWAEHKRRLEIEAAMTGQGGS